MTELHEIKSYSNYYLWRNRTIWFVIGMVLFYYLRKNKWKIVKWLLNL